MSLKTRVLVLKRIRAGDQDILAKVYGQGGVTDLLVRDGLLNSHRFFGLFEPFNVLSVDISQRGGVAIPNDVGDIHFFSYLSKDVKRFLWMSWVCGFILKNVSFYDEKLFNLFVGYMLREPKGREGLLGVRMRLEYLLLSGLKPKFLEEKLPKGRVYVRLSDGSLASRGDVEVKPSLLKLLKALHSSKRPERLRIDSSSLREMERLLDAYIEYHTK